MARKVAAARAIAPASPHLRKLLLNSFMKYREQPDHQLAVNPEPSSLLRKAGRPSNRSKTLLSAASEFEDLDEEPSFAMEKTDQFPQQVLKKVVIPVNGRSSIASSLSSVRDHSSEYDTPGTSVVVTPAESLMKGERSSKRPSRLSSNTFYQPEEPFKGKRKRLEVDELMEADALLARRLQEQEYGEDRDVAPRPTRIRNGQIEDPEDSLLSDLSRDQSPDPEDFPQLDLSTSTRPNRRRRKAFLLQSAPADIKGDPSQEESLEEDEFSETPMPRNKRAKTDHRTSLPSRAARDSANKSITDEISRQILDSEGSDLSDQSEDVSLFSSDVGSDAFEDSEEADEEAADVVRVATSYTTAVAANNSSSAPTAIPSTGRRGAGRRGAPSAQATNPTRGRRSWQRRVEDRVS